MQLRPYQQELDEQIDAAYALGCRNVLATLDCGGGKTAIFSSRLARCEHACVAIAHRQELVSQMSLTLAKYGIRHRIIGPTNVIKTIIQLHTQVLGRDFYDASARRAIAGVDTLVSWSKPESRHYDALMRWAQQVRLWITDECFPAGTLVDGRGIETLKPGDTVNSFNEMTGQLEKKQITRVFKNPAPKYMVRIDTTEHHVLYATSGHPFWTKRGWVEAGCLTLNDEVLVYDDLHMVRISVLNDKRSTALPVQKNRSGILYKILRVRASRRKQTSRKGGGSDCRMLGVWGAGGSQQASAPPMEKNRSSVLRPSLRSKVHIPRFIRNNGTNKPGTCFGTNESKQPHAARRGASKGFIHATRNTSSAEGSRREWKTSSTGRSSVTPYVLKPRVYRANRHTYGNEARLRLPILLQGGRGAPHIKNSTRSRWEQSQPSIPACAGQEKRRLSRWVGLDCIAVQERGDTGATPECCPDGYVYNIEVADNHTYIANGVVVHNCHHLLRENKWGQAVELFPNALGLGVTATAERSDGKGLGRHADGVFDIMVEGKRGRWLIDNKYLTDYRVFCPPSDLHLGQIAHGADGDYVRKQLAAATKASSIMGDVVKHYLKLAPGLLGVTFMPDVDTATEQAARFNQAGVPAEVLTAKTPDAQRVTVLQRLARREVLQLVNVDLFGEGFDLPAIEVVSMGRATESYTLYHQQFMRAMRLLKGKDRAIIIDHVNNVLRHGLPDSPRVYSLDRRDRKASTADTGAIPLRVCTNPECMCPYERVLLACPFCGYVPVPAARTSPEFVDGDLYELDPATLAAMRGEVEKVDRDPNDVLQQYGHMGHVIAYSNAKRHTERQAAQAELREAIMWYGGWRSHLGEPERVGQRRFYHTFGVDVLTAQALGRAEAEELTSRINRHIGRV